MFGKLHLIPVITNVFSQGGAGVPDAGMADGAADGAVVGAGEARTEAEAAVPPEGVEATPAVTPAAEPAGGGSGGSEVMALDPEFLAALPADIQAELIQQQAAARAMEAAANARAAAGAAGASGGAGVAQVADMDSASILATFPPELREEVLMTSDESLLSALPPDLVAEAQVLR